jgi:hypothetical protein
MNYIVHMNQSVPTENLTASLDNTFNNLGQENGFVSPKIPGLNAVVKISTKDSKIFSGNRNHFFTQKYSKLYLF